MDPSHVERIKDLTPSSGSESGPEEGERALDPALSLNVEAKRS